jgi:hypothetical protein
MQRAVAQLELEGEAGVGLGLPNATGAHERDGAQEAPVVEGDEPAARAGELDERRAARAGDLELVALDEHERRHGVQQRIRLACQPAALEQRPQDRERVGGRLSAEHGVRGRVRPPELGRRRDGGVGEPFAGLGRAIRLHGGDADELRLEQLDGIGRDLRGVLQPASAELECLLEMAGHPSARPPRSAIATR